MTGQIINPAFVQAVQLALQSYHVDAQAVYSAIATASDKNPLHIPDDRVGPGQGRKVNG